MDPTTFDTSDGLDLNDYVGLGILGDQLALQWYQVTHPQPSLYGSIYGTPYPTTYPGSTQSQLSGLMPLLLIGLVVFLVARK